MSKGRWKKFSFGRSKSTSSASSEISEESRRPPPVSFICPISSSLMSDPVILPSGHTFDRPCIEACFHFNYNPVADLSSRHLPSPIINLIPNVALKSAIIDWCDRRSLPHPTPISPQSARNFVRTLIMSNSNSTDCSTTTTTTTHKTPLEEKEQLVAENTRLSPPSSSSTSCSYPSSSSISSLSSSFEITNVSSSSLLDDDSKIPKSNAAAAAADDDVLLEDEIFFKLKSPQISVKDSALVKLKRSARESANLRLSLSTDRILKAVVTLISFSNNPSIQINATAALVNLSIEPINKVKIVRSGALPPLIDALHSDYCLEARCNAAGALFSLALDDNNKLAIGVLGAIPPLVNLFCQAMDHNDAHVEAGMALYHLSLAPNNIFKIAKMSGAVKAILNVATSKALAQHDDEMIDNKMRRVAMMVLANLAKKNEGRAALMDAGAVKAMVEELMRNSREDCCLALLYEISKGSRMRFRALASEAGAERVLLANKENNYGSGGVGKEMITRILKVMRAGNEDRGMMALLGLENEVEQEDEVASVVSDGLLSFRRRHREDFGGNSSPNSANF